MNRHESLMNIATIQQKVWLVNTSVITSAEQVGNVFTFVGSFVCLATRLLKNVVD